MDPLEIFLVCFMAAGFILVLYTAPIKYTDTQKAILVVGSAVFFLIATWHAGVRITFAVLYSSIDAAQLEEARKKVKALQLSPTYELAGVALYASYWFYLQINRAIQRTKQKRSGHGESA